MKNEHNVSPYQLGHNLASQIKSIREALRNVGHDDTCKECIGSLVSPFDLPGFAAKDLEMHCEMQVKTCEMSEIDLD